MLSRLHNKFLQRWSKKRCKEQSDEVAQISPLYLNDDAMSPLRLDSLPQCNRIRVYLYDSANVIQESFLCRLVRGYYPTDYDPMENWFYSRNTQAGDRFFTVAFTSEVVSRPINVPNVSPDHEFSFYVISYSLSDYATFGKLGKLYEQVLAARGSNGKVLEWMGGLVVALGSDLATEVGEVSRSEGQRFAEERDLPFHEASAKTGYGCSEDDFDKIIRDFLLQATDQYRITPKRT